MKVKACRSGTSANTYLSLSGSRACMPKCVWSATIRPTRQIERKKRRAAQVVVGADAAERRIYYCSDGQQAFLRPLACKAMLAGPLSPKPQPGKLDAQHRGPATAGRLRHQLGPSSALCARIEPRSCELSNC